MAVNEKLDLSWSHYFRAFVRSEQFKKLTPSAVKVLDFIRPHTNYRSGEAFPAKKTIAEFTGLSESTVGRAIKELVAAKLLRVEKRGKNNFYSFTDYFPLNDKVGLAIPYLPAAIADIHSKLKNCERFPTGNAFQINNNLTINIYRRENMEGNETPVAEEAMSELRKMLNIRHG